MARGIGRRFFLRTSTGLALGLPFLPSLLPRSISAQTMPPAKRFVGILSYSGQKAVDWLPSAAPAGYQLTSSVYSGARADGTVLLNDAIPGDARRRWAPLSDFVTASGISNVLTETLNPYVDKMNVVRGVDFLQGCGHSSGAYFGNYANSVREDEFVDLGLGEMPTIDQVLAHSDTFYPAAPQARSLALGTGSPNSISYTDYGIDGGPIELLQCYLNPRDVWEDLFGDFMSPDMPVEDPNRSLMNAIYEDYGNLSRHRRLSAADKQTIERHMTFLSEIERDLGATISAACVRPDAPRDIPNRYPWRDVSSIDDLRDTVSLLVDMACAAIRCDMTRVTTFKVQKALTDGRGTWAGSYHSSADVAGDWHQFAHDAGEDSDAAQNLVHINRWVASEVFGRFLQQLDVEEADGKTFLDNSLVCWGSELSYGHYTVNLPTVLAGSAGGAISTGNYVDYTEWEHDYANRITGWGVLIPGLPHNRLMVTILQAMGLSPSDYERDGLSGYGHNRIFGTPHNWPGDYDISQVDRPLPGLWVGS